MRSAYRSHRKIAVIDGRIGYSGGLNMTEKHLYQGAYLHAKTVCVDSSICCIGSANMDVRSFSINYETNLVVYDEAVTRELEAIFQPTCTTVSSSRQLHTTLSLLEPAWSTR